MLGANFEVSIVRWRTGGNYRAIGDNLQASLSEELDPCESLLCDFQTFDVWLRRRLRPAPRQRTNDESGQGANASTFQLNDLQARPTVSLTRNSDEVSGFQLLAGSWAERELARRHF